MSVFERSTGGSGAVLTLKESHIYASARMGFAKRSEDMLASYTAPTAFTRTLGNKEYEHTNHLGNVLVVTSDKKIPVPIVSTTNLDYYVADVRLTNDYYSFGMLMEGRQYSSNAYRYGFNGQEKDDEVTGVTGANTTAEFWEYDSRLGRRWNIDPKPADGISIYACFGNSPILFKDLKGDTTYRFNKEGIYLGMFDLDQKGIIGSIGEIVKKTISVHGGGSDVDGGEIYEYKTDPKDIVIESWEGEYFSFNDKVLDKQQLMSMKVGDVGLHFITDANIDWFMNVSDANNVAKNNYAYRWYWMVKESKEGLIDFSFGYLLPGLGIPPDNKYSKSGGDFKGGFFLFGDEPFAFNVNDAGNWLWGQSLTRLGIGWSACFLGDLHEWFQDSPEDQLAIGFGANYSPKIVPKPQAPSFILANKEVFMKLAKDYAIKAVSERGK